MASRKKRKFAWKKFLLIVSIILFSLSLSLVAFFLIVTADARLDLSKLSGNPSMLVVLDDSGKIVEEKKTDTEAFELSDNTKNAFVSIEDKRFYSHSGIDYVRIGGAVVSNLKSMSTKQGASTITQQLVKNTHLSSEKTVSRKLKEIKIAYQVEKEFSKDQILAMYLNKIYFGNGCVGIEAASRFYFGKSATELSIAESALLAGLVKAPSISEPKKNESKSQARKELVLKTMRDLGKISETEYDNAINEKIKFVFSKSNSFSEIYLNAAKKEAAKILSISVDSLETSPLIVETYFDESVQKVLKKSVENSAFSPENSNGLTPSVGGIVIDAEKFAVVAFDSKGSFDFETGKRQPGSVIKPILVYGPALSEKKLSPASFVLDTPTNFGGYTPQNAGGKYLGWTTVRDSIVHSKNIPAVKVLDIVGVQNAKNYAKKAGIEFEKTDDSLALALGGMTKGATLIQLAGAYATFANDGMFELPAFIKAIKKKNGEIVFERNISPTRVFDEVSNFLLVDMLRDVSKIGTARKLSCLPFEIASKTGTVGTDKGNSDCWNVSFSTKHVIAALVCNDKGESGELSNSVNGATVSTELVKNIFEEIYKNKLPDDFVAPNDIVWLDLDTRAFSNQRLELASSLAEQKFHKTEIFDKTNTPTVVFEEPTVFDNEIEEVENLKIETVSNETTIQKRIKNVFDRIFWRFKGDNPKQL